MRNTTHYNYIYTAYTKTTALLIATTYNIYIANLIPASGHDYKTSTPRGLIDDPLVLLECLSHARSEAGQFNTCETDILSLDSTYGKHVRVLGSITNGSSYGQTERYYRDRDSATSSAQAGISGSWN